MSNHPVTTNPAAAASSAQEAPASAPTPQVGEGTRAHAADLRARLIGMNFHILRIRRDIIGLNHILLLFVIDHLVITLQRLAKSSFPFPAKRISFDQRPVRNSVRFFSVNGDIADR